MKAWILLFGLLIGGMAHAESAQSYCDTENNNTQKMYGDLTSEEYRRGDITYEQLANNYAKQTTSYASRLNL